MNELEQELARLGEKLQQSLVLTQMRIANMPPSRAKVRGERAVKHAEKLFTHVSEAAQAFKRLSGFVNRAFGVDLDEIFEFTGRPRLAHGATYTGLSFVIEQVKKAIDELAAVNVALDNEVQQNGDKKQAA